MKYLVTVLLLFPLWSLAQDMSGTIGLITLEETRDLEKENILFKNEDGTTWYEFSFYREGNLIIRKDLHLFAFHPDYFLFYVRCIEDQNEHWRVIVNESSQESKFLSNKGPLN